MSAVNSATRQMVTMLAGISGMFLTSQALADTAVCTGKITGVANHANGANGLYVTVGSNQIFKVCSFVSQQFTVYPEDCKHMASLAAMAFAAESSVVIYVDNAPTTNCADIPNWHVANTRYFYVGK